MDRMQPRLRLAVLPVTLALSLAQACVTINVYFPEEKVKELSEQIEDAVQRDAARRQPAPRAMTLTRQPSEPLRR